MKQQIRPLTSLRFFAALLIVIDHATAVAWKRVDVPLYQGVTFFFVLSGFILTYTYPALTGWQNIRRFWFARFARIWPGYFASMLFVFAALPFTIPTFLFHAHGILKLALVSAALQAWIPRADFAMVVSGVAWSISAEVFFYLAFPLFIRNLDVTWRSKLVVAFAGAALMMIIVWLLRLPTYASAYSQVDAGGLIYSFPLARLFEFVLGMSAASLFRRDSGRLAQALSERNLATVLEAAILLLVAAQFLVGPGWYEWFGPLRQYLNNGTILWIERSGSSPLYAALIFVCALQKGAISRFLSKAPLVIGGEISFSIYLLHQTLLRWMIAHKSIVHLVPLVPRWTIFSVVVLALSYFWWAYIEIPGRRLLLSMFNRNATTTVPPTMDCEVSSVA